MESSYGNAVVSSMVSWEVSFTRLYQYRQMFKIILTSRMETSETQVRHKGLGYSRLTQNSEPSCHLMSIFITQLEMEPSPGIKNHGLWWKKWENFMRDINSPTWPKSAPDIPSWQNQPGIFAEWACFSKHFWQFKIARQFYPPAGLRGEDSENEIFLSFIFSLSSVIKELDILDWK